MGIIADLLNTAMRDFQRYTGDGLPGEPVGRPLPVGDPASGQFNPPKKQVRDAFLAIAGAADDLTEAVEGTAADRVQTGLDVTTSQENAAASQTYRNQAQVAAIAAGATLVTTLTDPVPANDTVEILQAGPGAKVFQVIGGAWSFVGWLSGPKFDNAPNLKADTSTTYGGNNTIVEAGGYRYVQDSTATVGFIENAGGVKSRVLPGSDGQFDLSAWAKAYGEAGNIDAVSDYLKARQAVLPKPLVDREVPQPKLNLVSLINSKAFQGFPSAVRHDGADYILYREGLGHVETPPFGDKARLMCAVRLVNGIAPSSTTEIFAVTGVDPRDPNVLRDDTGGAILVGGVFKVVMFEWDGSYDAADASAKVYDLDPADLAAGLVNPVTIPLPVQAVKSDVRQLENGDYAFVGYSISGTCYLVTTSDWAIFTTEEIGPGNEAAFCETPEDGALNVIVRAEERFGAQATIFYKKQTGGSWYVHDVLPYTLNAPTLVKAAEIRVNSAYPGSSDGWLLFARDKTGRTALLNTTPGVSELVCLWSKEDFGRILNKFTHRTVISGAPIRPISAVGDSHYCSVVAGQYDGQLQIYTYAESRSTIDNSAQPSDMKVWRIEGYSDPDQGVRPAKTVDRNYLLNADLMQAGHGFDLSNANSTIVIDPVSGRNVIAIINSITANKPSAIIKCQKGETLFLKARMRLLETNNALDQHVRFVVGDYENNVLTTIQTEVPQLNELDIKGVYRTVIFRPFIAPSDQLLLAIETVSGITAAESYIEQIEISDNYSRDMVKSDPVPNFEVVSTISFGVSPTGGEKASGTYSNNIWSADTAFNITKRLNGLPFPAETVDDIIVNLTNCTTNEDTVKCICTSAVVNSDGSVAVSFAVAPGETGTMTASVSARMAVTIKTS